VHRTLSYSRNRAAAQMTGFPQAEEQRVRGPRSAGTVGAMDQRLVPGTHPRVQAHMANNHGLITAHDARDLGVSTPKIRSMLRNRLWLVLCRGVYVEAEYWHSLDPWREQPLLRARARTIAMHRGYVLSHDSACHALGLDVLVDPTAPEQLVHVTRPGDTNAWTANGIGHHLARFRPEDVVRIDGLPVLAPARTVVDMARHHGLRSGLVTACSALRTGAATKAAMREVVDGMQSWPYITTVRAVIDLADGRCASALEALGLEFLVELGVGDIDLQWPMQRSDGRIAWCDARVGRHVFEFHGALKVLPTDQGGVAEKPAATVLFEERKRERFVTAEGLGVSNIYREDFFGDARRAALARVRAEVRQTVERFGTGLPEHLERNAREIRARAERPDAS
jgi:hypothetical protein